MGGRASRRASVSPTWTICASASPPTSSARSRCSPTTALVLVAHDYKYDVPVLKHALATPAGYIGLLGSSRRGAAILNLLREDGVAADALERVRVPIGLDLGAQSAPEIALAVLAEVLAVQRNATGLPIARRSGRGIK